MTAKILTPDLVCFTHPNRHASDLRSSSLHGQSLRTPSSLEQYHPIWMIFKYIKKKRGSFK